MLQLFGLANVELVALSALILEGKQALTLLLRQTLIGASPASSITTKEARLGAFPPDGQLRLRQTRVSAFSTFEHFKKIL